MKDDEQSFDTCTIGKTGSPPVRLRDSSDGDEWGDLQDSSE
jgi:hypothetical protein